jgi:hypothetical protein
MRKSILSLLAIITIIQLTTPIYAINEHELKVAFLHQGDLWIKNGAGEKRIAKGVDSVQPEWSYDGLWLAYSKDNKLWVNHVIRDKAFKVAHEADRFKWSPNQNLLSYKYYNSLQMADFNRGGLSRSYAVSMGVFENSWFPDGSGILASSQANLLPDGWTNPILYKIPLGLELEHYDQRKIQRFFELPNLIKVANSEIMAIQTSSFKWSPDGQWISFIVSPTASLSIDGNALCVLSADGKTFKPLTEMLNYEDWFQWAPNSALLGYIQGEGRFVFSRHRNKKLTVSPAPQFEPHQLTPETSADLDFTWIKDEVIVTARTKVIKDQNGLANAAPPTALYQVNVQNGQNEQITLPQKGYRDPNPYYVEEAIMLTWIRSNDTSEVWIAKPDGTNAEKWIEMIDASTPLSWFERKRVPYVPIQTAYENLYGNVEKQEIVLTARKYYNEFADSWKMIVNGKQVVKLGDHDGLYRKADFTLRNILGDDKKEVLIYRYSTGSGGAKGLVIYKPQPYKWVEIFSEQNPEDDLEKRERFQIRYLGDFKIHFHDRKTGLEATIPLNKESYEGIKDVENWLQKINWEDKVDPISEYLFHDTADRAKEIVAIQRVHGLFHADTIANFKTIYNYNSDEKKFSATSVVLEDPNGMLLERVPN